MDLTLIMIWRWSPLCVINWVYIKISWAQDLSMHAGVINTSLLPYLSLLVAVKNDFHRTTFLYVMLACTKLLTTFC